MIDSWLTRAFSTRSPSIPEFNAFYGVKNLCHTLKYLERPAIMESLVIN